MDCGKRGKLLDAAKWLEDHINLSTLKICEKETCRQAIRKHSFQVSQSPGFSESNILDNKTVDFYPSPPIKCRCWVYIHYYGHVRSSNIDKGKGVLVPRKSTIQCPRLVLDNKTVDFYPSPPKQCCYYIYIHPVHSSNILKRKGVSVPRKFNI